jgi:hypothetical protein
VVSALGFRPDTISVSDASWQAGLVQVSLIANAQSLAEVRVEDASLAMNAAMREFEGRRARRGGGASCIGPEDLAKYPSNRVTDFLRRGVQGLTLVDSAGILLPVSSRGAVVRLNQGPTPGSSGRGRSRAGATELVSCVFRIAVDGIPRECGYDLRELDPKELYGIEVYAGPSTVPAQYQTMARDGYCDLILIWTRAR